jgi:hypothetical protein
VLGYTAEVDTGFLRRIVIKKPATSQAALWYLIS